MTSVIIGATSVEQLKIDIAASEVTLSAEMLADIEKSTALIRVHFD